VTDDLVLYDIADRVATITLHRPDAMNAMTLDMGAQLVAAFERAEADDGVRAAVLTGAGKAFCAGDDVKEAWQPEALARGLAPLKRAIPKTTPETTHILEFEKPLIAAVNGIAVGIGLDLALVADIRLANQYARFAALYVNFNLVADFASMRRLPQLIGPSRAAELLFTGDMVDATEAERIGLVSRVVDAGELPGAAHELAARIAHKPPAALRAMKAGLAKGTGMSAPDLLPLGEYISRSLVALFATNDHHEAVAAFMERREPDFNGT
jgi:enoyl-CoA hydratase/carnithine racemase